MHQRASTDLCGGRGATRVPTATISAKHRRADRSAQVEMMPGGLHSVMGLADEAGTRDAAASDERRKT
jgi:hypothetical protein